MKPFYFTFMQKQGLLKDKFVCIHAPDEDAARQIMSESFKDFWGFCYGAEQFAGQQEQFNLTCLAEVWVDSNLNITWRSPHE